EEPTLFLGEALERGAYLGVLVAGSGARFRPGRSVGDARPSFGLEGDDVARRHLGDGALDRLGLVGAPGDASFFGGLLQDGVRRALEGELTALGAGAAAHLADAVEDGAADPVVGEGREGDAARGIETLVGLEETARAVGDEVVELDAVADRPANVGRDLAD